MRGLEYGCFICSFVTPDPHLPQFECFTLIGLGRMGTELMTRRHPLLQKRCMGSKQPVFGMSFFAASLTVPMTRPWQI